MLLGGGGTGPQAPPSLPTSVRRSRGGGAGALQRGSRLQVQAAKEQSASPPPAVPELLFDNETDPKCTVAVLVGAKGLESAALAAFRSLGLKTSLVPRPPSALPTAGDTFMLRTAAGGKVAVSDLPLVRALRGWLGWGGRKAPPAVRGQPFSHPSRGRGARARRRLSGPGIPLAPGRASAHSEPRSDPPLPGARASAVLSPLRLRLRLAQRLPHRGRPQVPAAHPARE